MRLIKVALAMAVYFLAQIWINVLHFASGEELTFWNRMLLFLLVGGVLGWSWRDKE